MRRKVDLEHEIRQRDYIYKCLNRAEYDYHTPEEQPTAIVNAIRELMMLLESKGIITSKLTADEED